MENKVHHQDMANDDDFVFFLLYTTYIFHLKMKKL